METQMTRLTQARPTMASALFQRMEGFRRLKTMIASVLIGVALITPAAAESPTANEDANKALALRFYEEINTRNLDAFDEFIAEDVIDQTSTLAGLEAMTGNLQNFITGFPDLQIENTNVIVKGDYVTVISTARGTNNGDMMGMPATGKPVEFQAIDVWLIKDGKLAEVWHVEQLLQMMMQLGAMGG